MIKDGDGRNGFRLPRYDWYRDAVAALGDAARGVDGKCRAYLDFVDGYCALGFPFLLLDGEPSALPREPAYLYLLPDLLRIPNERHVLCQYRGWKERPPAVSLLTWKTGDGTASIGPFGASDGKALPHVVDVIGDTSEDDHLPRRALRVHAEFGKYTKTLTICLEFPSGQVVVTADPQRGIRHVDWNEGAAAHPRRHVKRSSWDDMPDLVAVEWNDGTSWRDDSLFDPGNDTPLAIDEGIVPGHIRGADASSRHPHRIYLASDQARVIIMDKASPAGATSSAVLGGIVNDVLVVEHPDDGERDAVLATTDDGAVYLLETAGTGALEQRCMQLPGSPLIRLIGKGDGHLLAMDQHYNLLPIRTVGPKAGRDLWDEATASMHRGLVEQGSGFVVDDHARILLEEALRRIDAPTEDPLFDPLALLQGRLDFPYNGHNETSMRRRAGLHRRLMQRIYDWLRDDIRPPVPPTGIRSHEVHSLRVLPVLKLLQLPMDAPDHLWLNAMRYQDRLDAWLEHQGSSARQGVGLLVEELLARTCSMRREFLPAMHALRPLSVRGSRRMAGQIRHVRLLRRDIDGSWLAALWEHPRGLHVVRIPDNPLLSWQPLFFLGFAPLSADGAMAPGTARATLACRGLPTDIVTGAGLDEACGRVGKHALPCLAVATNRGEVVVYRWEKDRLAETRKWEIPPNVACLSLVDTKERNQSNHSLLAGGTGDGRKPEIWRLPLNVPNQKEQLLWAGDRRGQIVALQLRGDRELWAVERKRGVVRYWPEVDDLLKSNRQLGDPKRYWLDRRDQLHTLALSGNNDGDVVCGGRDRIAYAQQAGSGNLQWVAGCGNSLRHAHFLSRWEGGKGAWLLGGDAPDLLVMDRQGRLNAVVESLGPVTAICPLGDDSVLVGGHDGRIVLFSTQAPPQGAFRAAAQYASLARHPLRRKPDEAVCPKALSEALSSLSPSEDEAVTAQAFLDKVRRCLEDGAAEAVVDAFCCYADTQSPARLAWLLRPHEEAGGQPPGAGKLAFLAHLWDGLSRRSPDDPLCQCINAVLSILEPQAGSNGDAGALLDRIHACLWDGQRCAEGLDAKPTRRTLLCLAQAQRQWPAEAGKPARRLAEWCVRLQGVWKCGSEDAYARRLRRVMDEKLPWLVDPDGRQWIGWLGDLVGHLAEGKGRPAAPAPLADLEQARLEPLHTRVLADLQALWPEDELWQTWLIDFQDILSTVANAWNASPRVGWQVRFALNTLSAHVHEARFGLEAHPLPTLWWRSAIPAWEAAVKEREAELDREIEKDDDKYIDVRYSGQWRGGSRVLLRLEIANRTAHALHLESLFWDDAPVQAVDEHETPLARLPGLPTQAVWVPAFVVVAENAEGQVNGLISLVFREQHRGGTLRRKHEIHVDRGIASFRSEPEWKASLERLERLIRDDVRFLWLEGHVWSADEHSHLEYLLAEQCSLRIDGSRIRRLDEALDREGEIFSPDLEIDGGSPVRTLEQVHALFHDLERPCMNWAALALWRDVRSAEWPASMEDACGDRLPSREKMDTLLSRLLGTAKRAKALKDTLARLPHEALGAWCYGDPIYAGLPPDGAHGRYAPSAALLGNEFWRSAAGVPAVDLARFIGCDAAEIGRLRDRLQAVAPLATGMGDASTRDHAARRVLGHFRGGIEARAVDGAWRLDTRDSPFSLHFEDYRYVYLLSPQSSTARQRDRLPRREEPGLWLTVNAHGTRYRLPGEELELNGEEISRIVLSPQEQAGIVLNQIAAMRSAPDTTRVFRTAGGMPYDMIARHFWGRVAELKWLDRCLDSADGGGNSAVLIVGGRRMGKTTLRQRLEWACVNEGRPCVSLGFEGLEDVSGRLLAYEFWKTFHSRASKLPRTMAPPLEWRWPDSQKENAQQQATQQRLVEEWLETIRERTGKALLLTLDETDHLVRKDARKPSGGAAFQVFGRLRHLADHGKLALVATTYPHSLSEDECLTTLKLAGDTPLLNTFPVAMTLTAWSADDTWGFLHNKLAGLGVILPDDYRDRVLKATQGVPWIVHHLGAALCAGGGSRRRLVMPDDWQAAVGSVREAALKAVDVTVSRVAEEHDNDPSMGRVADSARLAGNRLADTLARLAADRRPALPRAGQGWGKAAVTPEELMQQMNFTGDAARLRKALFKLTTTGVLEGSLEDGNIFYLAAGMLAAGQ